MFIPVPHVVLQKVCKHGRLCCSALFRHSGCTSLSDNPTSASQFPAPEPMTFYIPISMKLQLLLMKFKTDSVGNLRTYENALPISDTDVITDM